MKQLLVAGIVVALATPLLVQAQGVNTGVGSGGQLVATSSDGKILATSPGGTRSEPGTAEVLATAPARSRMHYMMYGGAPSAYGTLGLTDEQSKAIEAIWKEAQAEYRQARGPFSQRGMSAEEAKKAHAARQEKQAEITKKHEARIADVLTPEQKALLGKITDLAEQKSAEDKKIAEKAAAESKQVLEAYQKKLYAVLPAEQAKKIEAADQTRAQSAAANAGAMK